MRRFSRPGIWSTIHNPVSSPACRFVQSEATDSCQRWMSELPSRLDRRVPRRPHMAAPPWVWVHSTNNGFWKVWLAIAFDRTWKLSADADASKRLLFLTP